MVTLNALRELRHRRQLESVDYRGLIDARYVEHTTGRHFRDDQAAAHDYLAGDLAAPPASLYFDHHHYLSDNPDVFASELHALSHYVLQGREEGRFPFDPYRVASQPQLGFNSTRGVAVCVPVYGAPDETVRCLTSVLRAGGYDRLIVCDDGTEDEQLRGQLHAWRDEGRLELVDHGGENRGFTRSANLLMEVAADHDVVLLNSDTEVNGRWVEGLRRAAYAGGRVASVTALSNNASIASWPLWPAGGPMTAEECERISSVLEQSPPDAYPLIPTCVGFCVYVRRDALDDVGLFDAVGFPRGYGEENDWSLRAQQAGWVHLLAPDVYVRHEGNRSFLGSKASNSLRGSAELRRRYPHYESGVARWMAAEPLAGHLPKTGNLLPALTPAALRQVHVTHAYGGGTDTAIESLASRAAGDHLVVRLGPSRVRVSVLSVDGSANGALAVEHELAFDELGPAEFSDVLSGSPDADIWLHDAHGVPPWVLTVLLNEGRDWRVFIHDMGAVCSRRFMVLPSGVGCLGPEPDRCTRCVSLEPSPHAGPSNWRHLLSGTALRGAAEIAAPSRFAAQQVADVAQRRVTVLPFDLDGQAGVVSPRPTLEVLTEPAPARRVAVIGTMVAHKGSRFLAPFAEWCFVHEPQLIIRLIGEWGDPLVAAPWPLAPTGVYDGRAGLEAELRAFLPHDILFVSPAAETYSLTFDEARRYASTSGARVIVPQDSVFAERAGADVVTFDRATPFPDLAALLKGVTQ